MSGAILACHIAGRTPIVVKRINGRPLCVVRWFPHDRAAAIASYLAINGRPPARVIER